MSIFKWFLIIASLVLGSEVSSLGYKSFYVQPNGIYCKKICDKQGFSGTVKLCFVKFEDNLSIMIARKPPKAGWKFFPVIIRDFRKLLKNLDSICDRVSHGDKYNGKKPCFQPDDPNPNVLKPKRKNLVDKLEEAVDKALENYNAAGKRSNSGEDKDVKEIITMMQELKDTANKTGANSSSPVAQALNNEASPDSVVSYTSEEWDNITETLAKARDEAEKDKQPDLKKLVPALDKALPVLKAVKKSPEKRESSENLRFLESLVKMVDAVADASDGRRKEEQKEVVENIISKMEKVKEEAANIGAEVPEKLIDDLDTKVTKLTTAMSSSQKRMEFPPILEIIKDVIDGFMSCFLCGDDDHQEQSNPPSHPPAKHPPPPPSHPPAKHPPPPPSHPPAKHPSPPSHPSGIHEIVSNHPSKPHPAVPPHQTVGLPIYSFPPSDRETNGNKDGHVDMSPLHPYPGISEDPSPPKKKWAEVEVSSHICNDVQKYFCRKEGIIVYASDNEYCHTTLNLNFACVRHRRTCIRNLSFLLQILQAY